MATPNHLSLEQKLGFIQLVSTSGSVFSESCRAYRICRQTGYKWWRLNRRSGLAGLANASRRPQRSPYAAKDLWVERLRVARRAHKRWGPRKLHAWLRSRHPRSRVPSANTLGRLLRKHGWSTQPLFRRRGPDRTWPAWRQAWRPNEVWTVDFKGYFHTADGRRCDPLTVRDAYSRYGLCVRVLHGHKLASVKREFLRLFLRFGLPDRIHADQGRPWAGPGPAWHSQLSAWWVSLGIRPTSAAGRVRAITQRMNSGIGNSRPIRRVRPPQRPPPSNGGCGTGCAPTTKNVPTKPSV